MSYCVQEQGILSPLYIIICSTDTQLQAVAEKFAKLPIKTCCPQLSQSETRVNYQTLAVVQLVMLLVC